MEPRDVEESPEVPVRSRLAPWTYTVLGVLLVALVVGAYWLKTTSSPVPAASAKGVEGFMQSGLDALYKGNDPGTAAAQFRKVLEQNPNHYGATFQLATALDRAGRRDEARPYWEKMLTMAETARDDKTLAAVRARLETAEVKRETSPEEAAMKAGLDALYARRDPSAAAAEFRKVLERNPKHYGATFQLAVALDQTGKSAEARPLWEKVLTMAEGFKDAQTAATARARLERRP